jgi:hypothetical protein
MTLSLGYLFVEQLVLGKCMPVNVVAVESVSPVSKSRTANHCRGDYEEAVMGVVNPSVQSGICTNSMLLPGAPNPSPIARR